MKTQFLVLAAAAALAAAPAIGQEAITESDLQVMDSDQDGAVSEAEYVAYMDRAFDALDANKNGSLAAAELATILTPEQIAGMDANRNGRIARAEFDAQVMRDFEAADRDGTGVLN